MTSASFKVKPLVLAVSSIISMLPAAHAVPVPTSIVISDLQTVALNLLSGTYSTLSSVEITATGTQSVPGSNAISNMTTIGTFSNAGQLTGYIGLRSDASIGSVVNSGTITAMHSGFMFAYGTTGSVVNTGLITGDTNGIYNVAGASISNVYNSGTLAGKTNAIYNLNASIGTIYNSGTILGNITSDSTIGTLNIAGGSNGIFGTLTGYDPDTVGTITTNGSPLVFSGGNILLNDHINASTSSAYASVLNNAALQVNNIIKIDGHYTQFSGGSLLIGVGDNAITTGDVSTDSGYGRLVVSGIADIASGSSVSLVKLGNYAFAQGQRYVVVQGSSGSNYNASDLNYSATGYTGSVKGTQVTDSVNSNQTDLLLTLGSADVITNPGNSGGSDNTGGNNSGSFDPISHATTSNARSAFSGLFNYPGTRADLLNLFNASAALGNSAEANRAGAQLSPAGVAGASVKASEAPTNAVLNVISQRSDVIRAAPTSGVATGEGDSGIAMWGRGFGGVASLDDSADASGYDARFGGLLIGADSAVSDQLRLGGVVSYAGTAVDSTGDNSGSKVNIKSYGVFGYANFDAQPWYVDFSTGVVRHQYDSTRHIDFTGFSGDATGSFSGTQYIISGQSGYPFQLGSSATTLTPIAGLTYSVLHQDGYSEDGGNGAGLTIDGATSTSLKSDLALKLEHSFKTPVGDVVPFAQAGWRHEFHDDALQSIASFSADATGSTSFVSTGAKPVRDTALFSVGTSLLSGDSLSLSVAYTGEAAGNYDSHSGNLLVRWQF